MQKRVPEHRAVVRALNDNFIMVQLLPDDAGHDCSACALSAVCSGTDTAEQPVFGIRLRPGATPPGVGRVVHIRAAASARRLASTGLFLIPAIIFLAVLFVCKGLDAADWLQVILALAFVALYYLVLYIRGNRRQLWQIVFVEPA